MQIATIKGMRRPTTLFMLVISALFGFLPRTLVHSLRIILTVASRALYSENIDSILEAYSTFEAAATLYPDDPVINGYLAFTRLLYYAFTYDSSGATPLMNQYGITRNRHRY